MAIFVTILAAYLSSILSKLFLVQIEEKKLRKNIDFVLIPFIYFVDKKKMANLAFKRATIGITELAATFFGIIFSLGLTIQLSVNGISITEQIILAVLFTFVFVSLLYLAVFDIIHLSIPENFLKVVVLIVVIANVLFGIYKLLIIRIDGVEPFPFVSMGTLGSIVAGLILGGVILIINRLSNKKAIGEGDIYLMLMIGFTLGLPMGFVSFFLTCILGSIVGITYSLIVRKFKGVLIPFVPLILMGFVFTLLIGMQLYSLFTLSY
ncbi:MAG: prepilin peptidase [Candidatus Dojkabacteria bacterium]